MAAIPFFTIFLLCVFTVRANVYNTVSYIRIIPYLYLIHPVMISQPPWSNYLLTDLRGVTIAWVGSPGRSMKKSKFSIIVSSQAKKWYFFPISMIQVMQLFNKKILFIINMLPQKLKNLDINVELYWSSRLHFANIK